MDLILLDVQHEFFLFSSNINLLKRDITPTKDISIERMEKIVKHFQENNP